MKRVWVLLLTAVMFLAGCAKTVETSPDEATYDESKRFDPLEVAVQSTATEPPTEPPTLDELAQARYDSILSAKPSAYAQLDKVHALNQMYGLQAGCEALALTSALTAFGYDLDIGDIVDDYLVYDSNMAIGYVGNPRYFYDGAGIYPPGMVKTAWNFIKANDAPLYPFDTTGLGRDDLYKFVDAGCPVLIWTTYDRSYPYFEGGSSYNGVYYPWYDTEHCVCLFGYHLGENEVKIADSWGGVEKWENADRFWDIYDEIGQFSMILMDVSDLV